MKTPFGRRLRSAITQVHMTLIFLLGILFRGLPDLFRYRKFLRQDHRRLMVIAHPDDEVLFFSRILLSEYRDLAVLCLTNGYDRTRRREFQRAMTRYGVRGCILNLPDRTAFSFLFSEKRVTRIIRELRESSPSCETVYTHNPEGEYGHLHHMIVSRAVTSVFSGRNIYMPASCTAIGDAAYRLPGHQLRRKEAILSRCYASQAKGIIESFPEWFYHERLVLLIS